MYHKVHVDQFISNFHLKIKNSVIIQPMHPHFSVNQMFLLSMEHKSRNCVECSCCLVTIQFQFIEKNKEKKNIMSFSHILLCSKKEISHTGLERYEGGQMINSSVTYFPKTKLICLLHNRFREISANSARSHL